MWLWVGIGGYLLFTGLFLLFMAGASRKEQEYREKLEHDRLVEHGE